MSHFRLSNKLWSITSSPNTFWALQKLTLRVCLPRVRRQLSYTIIPVIRNKFSHTLTLFFLCTYTEQWPTFFSDLFMLIQTAEQRSQRGFNRHLSLLFFHVVLEISGEVADQLIKSARSFNAQRHGRDGRVRDGVRERDAAKINEAVLTIISDRTEHLSELRKNPGAATDQKELDHVIEVVDWGVRAFSSYVGASTVSSYRKHALLTLS